MQRDRNPSRGTYGKYVSTSCKQICSKRESCHPKKGTYARTATYTMVASPWPHTSSRSSWDVPTMQLDTMDTIKEDEMNEEETRHKEKEDQDFGDKTFAAMNIL